MMLMPSREEAVERVAVVRQWTYRFAFLDRMESRRGEA